MIFRTAVTGYEDYFPLDYLHNNKTSAEFQDDVRKILESCPVRTISEYHTGTETILRYVDGYDIQDYINTELLKLGYTKAEICQVTLGGECFYNQLDDFPEIFPDNIKQRILKNNQEVLNNRKAFKAIR